MANALIFQDFLRTLDREAVLVEQPTYAAKQVDILWTIETPPACPLDGLDLMETCFPKAQDMLRQGEFVRHFADRAESIRIFSDLARVRHCALPLAAFCEHIQQPNS